jgi:hypothetical protein
MKQMYFVLCLICSVVVNMQAQTTILDFETAGTSTSFQYFGSPLDGSLNQTIANPGPAGINTSSMVAKFTKPAVAEVWAGAFSNPNPTVPVVLAGNSKVTVKVWMDHIGNLTLKLENSGNGGTNWTLTTANTKVNEWEELSFDINLPSIDAPNNTAAGFTYNTVTLFFDFGTGGTGTDVVSYFDDVVAVPATGVTTNILDFEAAPTSAGFQYFGSALDGTLAEIIDNPNASGINTSTKVTKYVKPGVSQVWAGAFSTPDLSTLIDLSGGGKVCVKVHMDHIGNLALKLEGSTSAQPNWIQQVSNTKVGEWEELCFDVNLPSLEAPNTPATGSFVRAVLFFDFGVAGTGTDVTSYVDDIVVKSGGGPAIRTVNFEVDMNNYASNFDKVYISGSFNNWAGDANPLLDPEFDGIFKGSITVPVGTYEYKITLDNWTAQEQFIGTEECTKTDPSGQFVNRLLLVSANADLPRFCFNSCYKCGEEIKLSFKLGMGGVTPNPDGVWLAGGGNFDVPGGKYKMKDANGDGIYELTVPRKRAFQSHFTFTNGPCPDYSCKEDLTGLPCGDPNNYNDRFLSAVQTDTVIATCFGACYTNATCTSGTHSAIADFTLFEIVGNPPAADHAVLVFGSDVNAAKSILVTNTLGQLVHQWEVNADAENFDLPTGDFSSGVYLVTVKAGNRFYTRKLVK